MVSGAGTVGPAGWEVCPWRWAEGEGADLGLERRERMSWWARAVTRVLRRIGGKNPVVTVAMDAGRGENLGDAVEELESRETEGGTAGGSGPPRR